MGILRALSNNYSRKIVAAPFPSIVVASTNDPYLSMDRANELASAWGSHVENVGPFQHIGSECKLGDWPLGRQFLERLMRSGLEG